MDSCKEQSISKIETDVCDEAEDIVSSTEFKDIQKKRESSCLESEGSSYEGEECIDVVGVASEIGDDVSSQPLFEENERYFMSRKKTSDDMSACDSSKTSNEDDCILFQQLAPRINCPEKIIFCIDLSSEKDETSFKLGNGRYSPLCMVRRIIEIFVHSKKKIDCDHEFSIMGLHEAAFWVKDFTCEPKEVISGLNELNSTKICDSCDLSSVFALIAEVFSVQRLPNPRITPPPYIFRVILIYGRSNCVPHFSDQYRILKALKRSPYFSLDILYIHEAASDENKCQEIFDFFCDLDDDCTSYIFEVARNTTKLYNCMAKLLAHPLQRPAQKDTFYKLLSYED